MTHNGTRTPARVIKLGGRAQSDRALPDAIAAASRDASRALCVVHGGGDEVSSLQRRLGGEPTFVGGRRVTTAADIDVVRMVLSGTVNKRLVAAIISAGAQAVGLSGEDASLLTARVGEHERLGLVGEPVGVNVELLETLFASLYVPVISPLARDVDSGSTLNVNGDDAAAAIAAALGAEELLFIADVPGVMEDGAVLEAIDADFAVALVARGTATAGMAAKLDAARRALAGGVSRVRIGDIGALRGEHSGTAITLSPTAV